MLSALIPPVGRKSAVPLAGQLTHESYVRPGPLVLGTAFLRSPTAASDRDRHSCYHRRFHAVGQDISAWLCMSPCRSDHIFTPHSFVRVLGMWSLRILDVRTNPVFPADCPHLSHFHFSQCPWPHRTAGSYHDLLRASSAGYLRSFQQIAKFIDSAVIHCLTTF